MNSILPPSIVCILTATLCLTGLSRGSSNYEMHLPPGNYAKQLGSRSLADPSGATHSKAEVAGKVVVAIFTIPNMSQGGKQEKWSNVLADEPKTKVSDRVYLVLVEDMSQAGWTKGMARDSMKKQFTQGSRPFLILDETGDVIKKFGVPPNTTRILIYDKHGKLRDVESDLDDVAATDDRIKHITEKLMAD